MNWRSTVTTTVFFILLLVTTPTFSCRLLVIAFYPVIPEPPAPARGSESSPGRYPFAAREFSEACPSGLRQAGILAGTSGRNIRVPWPATRPPTIPASSPLSSLLRPLTIRQRGPQIEWPAAIYDWPVEGPRGPLPPRRLPFQIKFVRA